METLNNNVTPAPASVTETPKSDVKEVPKDTPNNTPDAAKMADTIVALQNQIAKLSSNFDRVNTEKTNAEKAAEEANRAKMTETEKLIADLEKERDLTKAERAERAASDEKAKVATLMNEHKLPAEFKPFVRSDNIADFNAIFQKAVDEKVQIEVQAKLKASGVTVKTDKSSGLTLEAIKAMTPTEAKANLKEIKEFMNKGK